MSKVKPSLTQKVRERLSPHYESWHAAVNNPQDPDQSLKEFTKYALENHENKGLVEYINALDVDASDKLDIIERLGPDLNKQPDTSQKPAINDILKNIKTHQKEWAQQQNDEENIITPSLESITTDSIKKLIQVLTENPQQYFPKDLMDKLQGREVQEHSIHSLHADPYSEVLLVLANAYASLTYLERANIAQKTEKQNAIKTDLVNCLKEVFKANPIKLTCQERLKNIEKQLVKQTTKCMDVLGISPKDFKIMKSYPPFRLERSVKQYTRDDNRILNQEKIIIMGLKNTNKDEIKVTFQGKRDLKVKIGSKTIQIKNWKDQLSYGNKGKKTSQKEFIRGKIQQVLKGLDTNQLLDDLKNNSPDMEPGWIREFLSDKTETFDYEINYNPCHDLTKEQIAKNKKLSENFISEEKNILGIKNEELATLINDELKNTTVANGSSSGKGVATCSNLASMDVRFKGSEGDFKLKMTVHSDTTPLNLKRSSVDKKEKKGRGLRSRFRFMSRSNPVKEERIEITALNIHQLIQVGLGELQDKKSAKKYESKPIFLTKSFLSQKPPLSTFIAYSKNEKKMLDGKNAALERVRKDLKDKNVAVIALWHPFDPFRYLGASNRDGYKALFKQLLNNLGSDIERGDPGHQSLKKLDAVISNLDASKLNWADVADKLNTLINTEGLSSGQKIGLQAMARIATKNSTFNPKGHYNKWRNFEFSALDNMAVSGICGDKNAVVDSHCKSGKDRTFQEAIFSMSMMAFSSQNGRLPDFGDNHDREAFSDMYVELFSTRIAHRHASQDNVGCWGLKTMKNLPKEIRSKLIAKGLVVKGGPQKWNNITNKCKPSFLSKLWKKIISLVTKFTKKDAGKASQSQNQTEIPNNLGHQLPSGSGISTYLMNAIDNYPDDEMTPEMENNVKVIKEGLEELYDSNPEAVSQIINLDPEGEFFKAEIYKDEQITSFEDVINSLYEKQMTGPDIALDLSENDIQRPSMMGGRMGG